MMKKKQIKRYIITAAVGLIIAAAIIVYEYMVMDESSQLVRMFSDGFFVSGILMLCAMLLCFASNGGGFDSFSYLGKKIRHRFERDKSEKLPDYYTYVTARREKGRIPLLNLTIVAGAMLVVSAILAFLA